MLGEAVDAATQGVLDHNRSPGGKVGQTDNDPQAVKDLAPQGE